MILVCDLDGTVANNDHRQHFVREQSPKDWDSFHNPRLMQDDTPYPNAKTFFSRLLMLRPIHIVFLTGRPEKTRAVTSWWLYGHLNMNTIQEDDGQFLRSAPVLNHAMLIMKSDNDYRKANLYKEQAVNRLLAAKKDDTIVFIDDDERCYETFWRYGIVLRPPEAWLAAAVVVKP